MNLHACIFATNIIRSIVLRNWAINDVLNPAAVIVTEDSINNNTLIYILYVIWAFSPPS